MRSAAFIVPRPLDAVTGGSIYDRRIIDGLRARHWTIGVIELDGTYPRPSAAALAAAEQTIATIAYGETVVVDGLVFGAMPEVVERQRDRIRFIPIVHLPLALEVGIDEEDARQFELSERRGLVGAYHVIVTGPSIVDVIERSGVDRRRISVVQPGCDREVSIRHNAAPDCGGTVKLLSVANVTAGKGYEDLVHALAGLKQLDWTLTIVGDVTRQPMTVERINRLIDQAGLNRRISMVGALTGAELTRAYAIADVFVLATLRETFGMAVAEALAHRLPVISTTTGEIPRLVGDEAGLLCAPGDIDRLRECLARVIADRTLLSKLRNGAAAATSRLRSWDEAVDEFDACLVAAAS